jgi:rubrerythrin
VSEAPATRRDAIRRSAVAAAGLYAIAASRPSIAGAQASTDEDLRDFLVEAIGLEQIAALAYSTATKSSDVDPQLSRTLENFGGQEEAHASALRSAIDELGFDPPDQPDSPSDTAVFDDVEGLDEQAAKRLSDLLSELQGLRGRERLLSYLAKVEDAQLDYYLGQAPALDSEDLSTTSAEIAGCQAQHLVVLSEQSGDPPSRALAAASETVRAASAAAEDTGGDAAAE